mmetsp:Transcript_16312/g.34272  ORF Transcript_16312/g.34272 Transcript_16312/m.34272 type:complete len:80 (-) Transcript_16312:553-792(-)
MHAAPEDRVIVESGEESRGGPDRVDDDRVYKSRKHERIAEVGLEFTPLRNGSSYNSCSSGSKGELEEPSDQVPSRGEVG